VFVELNNKDVYCAHRNSRDFSAFMNMSQLKLTQIWNMRLNKYLRYWSLKALKSVSVTLYKLSMKYAHFRDSDSNDKLSFESMIKDTSTVHFTSFTSAQQACTLTMQTWSHLYNS